MFVMPCAHVFAHGPSTHGLRASVWQEGKPKKKRPTGVWAPLVDALVGCSPVEFLPPPSFKSALVRGVQLVLRVVSSASLV
jgi:hypothetical protein